MSATAKISQLLKGLEQARKRQRDAAIRAATKFAAYTLTASNRYCPVLTGGLKASGVSETAEITGGKVTCKLGYGVSYAAAVHENVGANFRKDRNPLARAKFLEVAVRENGPKFAPFIAEEVRKAL